MQCRREAAGLCRFCGSAVCREHAKRRRFVAGVASARDHVMFQSHERFDYVVVEDALWCGTCAVAEVKKP